MSVEIQILTVDDLPAWFQGYVRTLTPAAHQIIFNFSFLVMSGCDPEMLIHEARDYPKCIAVLREYFSMCAQLDHGGSGELFNTWLARLPAPAAGDRPN